MVDFEYLYQGLCGLANAHRASTLAGHLGAAVAAGYFFGEDNNGLPEEVYAGVENELKRIIKGEEAIWFNVRKAGMTPTDLFKGFPQEAPQENLIDSITLALNKNISKTRQSGHNVIFTAIAMRILKDHPEYATPKIVTGVRKLIEGFNNAHAGRGFFGKQKGWKNGTQLANVKLKPLPEYKSISQMAKRMLETLIAEAKTRRQGFGGLVHLINHAAAIVELENLGFSELAKKGLPAHLKHLQLWLLLPDVSSEIGKVSQAKEHPFTPEYWNGMLKRDQAQLTHRIKTLYGFYTLLKYLDDKTLNQKAEEALLYLMA